MRNSNEDMEPVEEFFRQVRSEISHLGSSRDEIDRRVAATAIRKGSKTFLTGAIAAVMLLAFVGFLGWRSFSKSRPAVVGIAPAISSVVEESKINLGDVEVTEHMAAIIDHRVVVVVWSFRGSGVASAPLNAIEYRVGKYQMTTLREVKAADGRTVVCSLLVPAAGVKPVLEPPSVYATREDRTVIALGVSPRSASIEELADAIHLAGGAPDTGFGATDVLREIQRYSH